MLNLTLIKARAVAVFANPRLVAGKALKEKGHTRWRSGAPEL